MNYNLISFTGSISLSRIDCYLSYSNYLTYQSSQTKLKNENISGL